MAAEERMKALEAARLLESAVLGEAFARLDGQCVSKWRTAKSETERTECWMKQKVLFEVKRELFSMIQDAALKERGKNKELNVALDRAKGKV